MSNIAKFIIISEITTKQRPRATIIKGHARVYDPGNTVYENLIKLEFQRQCGDLFFNDKPLKAKITAYFKAPKAIEKYLQVGLDLPCAKHKDLDNIAKIVLDSLNGVAYNDDKQIVELEVYKKYTLQREYVEVIIEETNDLSLSEVKEKYKELKKKTKC